MPSRTPALRALVHQGLVYLDVRKPRIPSASSSIRDDDEGLAVGAEASQDWR